MRAKRKIAAPGAELLPYQKRWANDNSRWKFGLMSRQVGKDFSSGFEGNRSGLDATAANRIITGNNSDLIFKNNPAVVEFRYQTSSNAWIITGFNSLSPLSLPTGVLTNDFVGTIHATAFNADQGISAGQQITTAGGVFSTGFESPAFSGQADPMGGDPVLQLFAVDSSLMFQVENNGDVDLVSGNDLNVTGTIYASNAISGNAGFASFATNTGMMGSTGYTNTGTTDLDVTGMTGVSIIYTNLNNATGKALGTITVKTGLHLKVNTGVAGTSMAADLIEGH